MHRKSAIIAAAFILACSPSLSVRAARADDAAGARKVAVNPSDAEVATALEEASHANRIPTVLLKALAWQASGWRQWDEKGGVIEPRPEHVGLLGVWVGGKRVDAERLRTDWRYNVEQGAKQLALCWYRAPIIGNGRLEDGRNILECWYFALGRYWEGSGGEAANRAADGVLDALASGGSGRWTPGVRVTRPTKEALSWGRNVIGAPAPWHFGDVAPRRAPVPVVSLEMPYLNQVWDTPDDFNGSGACGPTSMVMVLASQKKAAESPLLIRDSYLHQSTFGGHIPTVYARVCEPNRGAVHAKMLDYLRPTYPGVAIFYDEKATFARVKAELDGGRPCLIGTQVTPAGHIMAVRGYTTDGRLLVNDPAGDYYQAALRGGPMGGWSPTGSRYWNGDGGRAVYDWDALEVRWVMTLGPKPTDGADRPEDQ
jgi:hypothetical protein